MITLDRLTKTYGTTTAVDDLSLDIHPGRVTGFLGPNGSGKSTTMRMILGLAEPTSGTATIDGRPYASLRHPLHEVGALLDATACTPVAAPAPTSWRWRAATASPCTGSKRSSSGSG